MNIRALAAATVVIIAGTLAACATEPAAEPSMVPTAEPSTVPTPSATGSATPTLVPASTPETRFDLTCDEISTAETVSAFINQPIEKQDALAAYVRSSEELPRLIYIEALGGLVCEWSNGTAPFTNGGDRRDPKLTSAGLTVLILPDADAQFATFESKHGNASPLSCRYKSCSFDKLIDGYWVSVYADDVAIDDTDSPTSPPLLTALVDSLEGQVAALGAPDARWTPPATTLALSTECDSIISPEEAQTALAIPGKVEARSGRHGGWSVWAGAADETGGLGCGWQELSERSTPIDGWLSWLPAGEWAADRLLPITSYPTAVSPVVVANLAPDDDAFIRCDDGTEPYCVVDLIIGGNWVQLRGYATSDSALSARDRAIALAGAVAASIYR
jgi:hypothetical protein